MHVLLHEKAQNFFVNLKSIFHPLNILLKIIFNCNVDEICVRVSKF